MEPPGTTAISQFAAAKTAEIPSTSQHSVQPHGFQQTQQLQLQDSASNQQQRLDHAQRRQQLFSDLVAGMVTSGIYTSLTYPVHRVKILLQTQDANPRILSGKVARYSFVHSFHRLAQEQGILGLWRGNTPYVLRHVPSISMSFAFKDWFREILPRYDASQRPFAALSANAAAGAAAGALSLALVYPFEFATVRLAADVGGGAGDRQYGHGMMSAWIQAIRTDGPLSCYQGFGVAVLSMAAYKALYFGLYDTAKTILLPQEGRHLELAPKEIATRTALAAATTYIAASVTYPLDIIRKRLIVDVGSERKQYDGSFKAAVGRIYASEGIKGFYRFYAYDMFFRLGGGVLLVGYDLLRSHRMPRWDQSGAVAVAEVTHADMAATAVADATAAGAEASAAHKGSSPTQ